MANVRARNPSYPKVPNKMITVGHNEPISELIAIAVDAGHGVGYAIQNLRLCPNHSGENRRNFTSRHGTDGMGMVHYRYYEVFMEQCTDVAIQVVVKGVHTHSYRTEELSAASRWTPLADRTGGQAWRIWSSVKDGITHLARWYGVQEMGGSRSGNLPAGPATQQSTGRGPAPRDQPSLW